MSLVTLLTIWVAFAVFGLVGRRDRRLLRALPMGAGWGVIAVVLVTVLLVLIRPGVAQDGRLAVVVWLVIAGLGGGMVPGLMAWGRRGLVAELARFRRNAGVEWGWTLLCVWVAAGSAAVYAGLGLAIVGVWGWADGFTLFESDSPRYMRFLTGVAAGEHGLVHKHPVFLLPAAVLRWMGGLWMDARGACVLVGAIPGGVSVGLMAVYGRRVTGSRVMGLLLGMVWGASAGMVLFGALCETYAMAGASLVLLQCAFLGGRMERRRGRARFVAAAVLSVGVTLTHAMVVMIDLIRGRWGEVRLVRRVFGDVGHIACGVALLFGVQGVLVPVAVPERLPGFLERERHYMAAEGEVSMLERLGNVARGMLVENVVAPGIAVGVDSDGHPGLRPGKRGAFGWTAAAVWLALMGVALAGLIRSRGLREVGVQSALLVLVGFGVLHVFYGNRHVFLFSCQFTPFVMMVVGHGLVGFPRRVGVALLGVGLVFLVVNQVGFVRELLAVLAEQTA